MTTIKVSAFRWVPDFARGLVRDLRVRWALEEAGLDYQEHLIGVGEEQSSPEYLALQPFGQVPAYREGDLAMFESGAIVLHIAERSPELLPPDAQGRARAQSWMFAALNSIEPYLSTIGDIDLFAADQEWARLRRPSAIEEARTRLRKLANWLEGRDYLEDRFTAGDLLMTTVLRIPRHTDLIASIPVLEAYRQRNEARPAFQRALNAQLEPFEKNAPPQ